MYPKTKAEVVKVWEAARKEASSPNDLANPAIASQKSAKSAYIYVPYQAHIFFI